VYIVGCSDVVIMTCLYRLRHSDNDITASHLIDIKDAVGDFCSCIDDSYYAAVAIGCIMGYVVLSVSLPVPYGLLTQKQKGKIGMNVPLGRRNWCANF